jgi:hypothetical protein
MMKTFKSNYIKLYQTIQVFVNFEPQPYLGQGNI